jgi:CHAT domain-containing protein
MVGFAWAFMQSGVRNVIAGLWEVDDAYSSQLMINLYKGLASGDRPSLALRKAKLELIHSANGSRLKPVYWAPFQTTCASPKRGLTCLPLFHFRSSGKVTEINFNLK